MNTKWLFVPIALIGVCFVVSTPASSASISFSEGLSETAPITVTTDIANAIVSTSSEFASLSLGDVTGQSTLIFRRQMTNVGTMTGEGGGKGVSDVLSLFSFGLPGAASPDGTVGGFLATFQSDGATGISPPPGNFPSGVTNLRENGNLQLLTPSGFSVVLPGLGSVDLAVSARSDVSDVPLPAALPLFATGLGALGLLGWRRSRKAAA
jgi:hypothetical protein